MNEQAKVGHWIPIHVSNIWRSVFSCSECEKSVCIYISLGQRLCNYCPSCFAKMERCGNNGEVRYERAKRHNNQRQDI